jgi:hypothetical protein
MLDVHPVRHAPHTFREFLLHIATISVGLLIAIALEQTVEALQRLHERHQLQEELRTEGLHNRDGLQSALKYLDELRTGTCRRTSRCSGPSVTPARRHLTRTTFCRIGRS